MTERSPKEGDRRWREDNAHSPTHAHPYSPVNGTQPHSPFHQYSSRPSTSAAMSRPSAISPRLGPPPSPRLNGPSRNGSLYSDKDSTHPMRYDPLSEHREAWRQSPYPTRSPKEVCQGSFPFDLLDHSFLSANVFNPCLPPVYDLDPRTHILFSISQL